MLDECAYCGEKFTSKRYKTEEHVLPAHLLRDQRHPFRTGVGTKKTDSQMQLKVKDVCCDCNNRVLSNLDNGLQKLFLQHFAEPVSQKCERTICLWIPPLARWLVKTAYNSARYVQQNLKRDASPHALAQAKSNVHKFARLVPYILGNADAPTNLNIFTNLILPSKLIDGSVRAALDLRVSASPGVEPAVAKIVFLHSFAFYIMLWPETQPEQDEAKSKLEVGLSNYGKLDLAGSEHTFKTNGETVWDTLKHTIARDANKVDYFLKVQADRTKAHKV